jgi:acyl CoA:acetate/3-ketoacid CoA transferase beta subunit
MRPTRSRTITSLLAAVGAGFAVSAMIGAPAAVADVCQPGMVGPDGQCTFTDNNATTTSPAPPDGTGKLMCNQAGHCSYFPDS